MHRLLPSGRLSGCLRGSIDAHQCLVRKGRRQATFFDKTRCRGGPCTDGICRSNESPSKKTRRAGWMEIGTVSLCRRHRQAFTGRSWRSCPGLQVLFFAWPVFDCDAKETVALFEAGRGRHLATETPVASGPLSPISSRRRNRVPQASLSQASAVRPSRRKWTSRPSSARKEP